MPETYNPLSIWCWIGVTISLTFSGLISDPVSPGFVDSPTQTSHVAGGDLRSRLFMCVHV